MGSVKDLVVDEPASAASLGTGRFRFSDRYSVFDWGEMPDHVEGKGASLCLMGAYNFELLEDAGVATHYRGVIPHEAGDGGGVDSADAVALDAVDAPPRSMAVDLAQVPGLPFEDGGYDYDAYHAAGEDNYVVPLEVVFRNSVPVGSSLRDRREPDDLGLDLEGDEWPADETVALDEPVVEFSTKYEERDRYLDEDEARRISGLDEEGFAALREVAEEVNRLVTARADDVGLAHQDGKIECVASDGEILVADVVGTFDENRFLLEGQQLSKEFLRQFYKQYDPEWVEAVGAAKREADEAGVADWRELCEMSPKPLPEDVAATASDLYRAGANRYTGEDWFDAPSLDDVVDRIARTTTA